jgi:adenosylhomocysteine nucleosidase
MRYLVFSAIAGEIEQIAASVEHPVSRTVGGIPLIEGELHGKSVTVAHTGSGKVNAAVMLAKLVSEISPDALIAVGLCGAVNEELVIGNLIEVRRSIQYDLHIGRFGLSPGEINGLLPRYLESPTLFGAYPPLTAGTADIFLDGSQRNAYLPILKELGVDVVDMESYSWMAVSSRFDLPLTIIRIVSDTGSQRPKRFPLFLKEASGYLYDAVAETLHKWPSEKSPTIL